MESYRGYTKFTWPISEWPDCAYDRFLRNEIEYRYLYLDEIRFNFILNKDKEHTFCFIKKAITMTIRKCYLEHLYLHDTNELIRKGVPLKTIRRLYTLK